MKKTDERTIALLKKINDVNKRKLEAKLTIAKAKVDITLLKEKLLATGNLSDADIAFLIRDIQCW